MFKRRVDRTRKSARRMTFPRFHANARLTRYGVHTIAADVMDGSQVVYPRDLASKGTGTIAPCEDLAVTVRHKRFIRQELLRSLPNDLERGIPSQNNSQ
jgi:hypothetical protein